VHYLEEQPWRYLAIHQFKDASSKESWLTGEQEQGVWEPIHRALRPAVIPLIHQLIGSQILPGDKIVVVLATAMVPGEKGTALRGDGQAGDVQGRQIGICIG